MYRREGCEVRRLARSMVRPAILAAAPLLPLRVLRVLPVLLLRMLLRGLVLPDKGRQNDLEHPLRQILMPCVVLLDKIVRELMAHCDDPENRALWQPH